MQADIHYGYTFSHTHVHTHSYTYALIAKRSHMKLLIFNSEHYIQCAEQNSHKGNILFSFIFSMNIPNWLENRGDRIQAFNNTQKFVGKML